MKRRDILKKLQSAGYSVIRDDGSHTNLWKPGSRVIQVPRHREITEITAKQILKDAGLK